AKLFTSLTQAMFGEGGLPWTMIAIGAAIGVAILSVDALLAALRHRVRLYVMPVAVGIYLPPSLSVPILFGGVVHHLLVRRSRRAGFDAVGRGVLIASGAIAGESLVGVFSGGVAYLGYESLPPVTEWA